jgi:hypothetical protein
VNFNYESIKQLAKNSGRRVDDLLRREQVVKAAHRDLVKLHHPDRGGDLETMQTVNAAFDLLKGAS